MEAKPRNLDGETWQNFKDRKIAVNGALTAAEMHMASLYKELLDLELHIKSGHTENALSSLVYLKEDLAAIGENIAIIYANGFESSAEECKTKHPNLTLFQKKDGN